MTETWTLSELVAEVATRIAALPAPRNGQVRAIPDERTVRYYGTIGLLDRPSVMRGRTALYGRRHVAQVVAIKRLQALGRSLSEIQTLWPTLDARTLARMSGVELEPGPQPPARAAFWKRDPVPPGSVDPSVDPSAAAAVGEAAHGILAGEVSAIATPDDNDAVGPAPVGGPPNAPHGAVELRIELAPNVILSLSVVDDAVAISPADVRALRVAAAPLVAELASRRITPQPVGEEP